MMGKPMTGRSFGGCIRYVVNKQEAKILAAEGVRIKDASSLIEDFNLQRRMRPELGKAVGHLVLSWSKEDLPKLSDEIMVARAKEYMGKVGIRDTQYVIVGHSDRQHPHLHLIYNRVDNNGKTITDKNNFAKNVKACREITLKYGYHLGEGKDLVNRQALKGKEKIRYELYDSVKAAIKSVTTWKRLEAELAKQGINIAYKFRSGTNEVQGISFEKNAIKMKGSAIDRSLSYARINTQLNTNMQRQQYHLVMRVNSSPFTNQQWKAYWKYVEHRQALSHVCNGVKDMSRILLTSQQNSDEVDPLLIAIATYIRIMKRHAKRAKRLR
jgi:hypothetical protein